MRKVVGFVGLGLVVLVSVAWGLGRGEGEPGALVLVGGGGTPEGVVARALELAGGERAVVAILPQASEREDRGVGSAEMFAEAGAREAFVIEELGQDGAREELERADLVWMPGGSQNRLLAALEEVEWVELLRALHASGVVLGGTSAGAAVQSERMITGRADDGAVRAEGTELVTGLGLWEAVIVDQHALRRRRLQRLLSAVLDHSSLVGVAIDERTAVVVRGSRFEVLGESSVVVIDARGATVAESEAGEVHAARDLELHLLRAGMDFDLERGE